VRGGDRNNGLSGLSGLGRGCGGDWNNGLSGLSGWVGEKKCLNVEVISKPPLNVDAEASPRQKKVVVLILTR